MPARELSEAIVDKLRGLIGAIPSFEFALIGIRTFPQGVVYLAPEPAKPFIELTKGLGRAFGLLPFGGEFGDEPVPHLTLAMPGSRATLTEIATQLDPLLPIRLRADEAWLMVGSDEEGWSTMHKMPLGLRPPSEPRAAAPG